MEQWMNGRWERAFSEFSQAWEACEPGDEPTAGDPAP